MTDPRDIAYPSKPDGRGSAKRYHNRRAYYFGRHNSPDSYTLFAAWKERLLETGVAPNVQDLRDELARRLELDAREQSNETRAAELEAQQQKLRQIGAARYLYSTLAVSVLSVVILGCVLFWSSERIAVVDGISLTHEEVERIRGLRLYEEMRTKQIQSNPNRDEELAELTAKLIRLGPLDGNLHRHKDGT